MPFPVRKEFLLPVVIVVVAVLGLHLEARDLHQRAMIAGAKLVVHGPVLNVEQRFFARSEEDEPGRFR